MNTKKSHQDYVKNEHYSFENCYAREQRLKKAEPLPVQFYTKKEILEQGKALKAMGISTIEGIEDVAAEMRKIINEYEQEFGEPPTADAIVWILSEHHDKDMRK